MPVTDLLFPLSGVSVVGEVGNQPAGSTPVGTNVRLWEAIAERARGGSRPGLSRIINARVNGNAPVQHLAVLVSTADAAFNTDYPSGDSRSWAQTNPTDETVTDPSTNNNAAGRGNRNPSRVVRQGGSGRKPLRDDPPAAYCRTYHVAAGYTETLQDFTICTSDTFPFDFTDEAWISPGGHDPLIAPGPAPPTLGAVNTIIGAIEGADTYYDDFTDVPS